MVDPKPSQHQNGRIVGIDYGLARIGIAISDTSKLIATPLITLKAEKRSELTAEKLVNTLREHQEANRYNLEEIVIGMPLLLSGKTGMLADEVNHFAALLRSQTSVPITLWDERLTSVQAERSLREGTLSRKKRTKHVDTVAAVILLQSYLDFRNIRKATS